MSFNTSNDWNYGDAPMAYTHSADNININSVNLRGSVDPNGESTDYYFEYGRNSNLGYSTVREYAGSGDGLLDVSQRLYGLSYDTTYYYRIVAVNSNGISRGSILSFRTSDNNDYDYGDRPDVYTLSPDDVDSDSATLSGTVDSNGDDTYAWFEYGTDYDSLYYTTNSRRIWSSSNYTLDQTIYNLSSDRTYYYRIVARNDYGTSRGSIRSFRTSDGYNYGNEDRPEVITNSATYISTNSALLNGRVNPNDSLTTAWFEYGTTSSFGYTTNPQPMGAGNSYYDYSYAVSGLSPNTTYYFRAVARNTEGTSYGQTFSFRTNSTYVVPVTPTYPTGPTIIYRDVNTGAGESCLILVPSVNTDKLVPGEGFTYTITYKNGCNYDLSNTFLKIILPTDVSFEGTNTPFFNKDANGISYNLGVVSRGAQSAISISASVKSGVNPGDTLIFSSVMNFDDEDGDFNSVSAYLTTLVGNGKTLGANILEAFGDLFSNWLFLLLLLLLAGFLIWWIFFRDEEDEEVDVLKE